MLRRLLCELSASRDRWCLGHDERPLARMRLCTKPETVYTPGSHNQLRLLMRDAPRVYDDNDDDGGDEDIGGWNPQRARAMNSCLHWLTSALVQSWLVPRPSDMLKTLIDPSLQVGRFDWYRIVSDRNFSRMKYKDRS